MKEIYLDNAATTPCDPDVAQVAFDIMTTYYGNPSSLHKKGIEAQKCMDTARAQLAEALGCTPREIVFTATGTEANNLAVFGAISALRRKGNKIVATSTMHSSILRPLEKLKGKGLAVSIINPRPDGNADVDAVVDAVDDDTILVVFEFVNSEVGSITPVEELCRLIRRKNEKAFIHCDAVQALGKVPFAAKRLGVDSLSVSAHKIHAPKGCGALYLRKGARVLPIMQGGGQEWGLRAGTENTPAIGAFGYGAEKATKNYAQRFASVQAVREYFVNKAATLPDLCINSPADATPYISNISIPGYRSETMLHFLAERGICVSSGSACAKGAASHVLSAMGLADRQVDSALRVSISPYTTTDDIDAFFAALQEGMQTLTRRN